MCGWVLCGWVGGCVGWVFRGGVEGLAGTANAVPLFTVVCIAVPLFKAGRTCAANVPPECAIVARVRIVHTHGPVP